MSMTLQAANRLCDSIIETQEKLLSKLANMSQRMDAVEKIQNTVETKFEKAKETFAALRLPASGPSFSSFANRVSEEAPMAADNLKNWKPPINARFHPIE